MAVNPRTLRAFPFLRRLADADLARLASQVGETHYPAGTLIFPDRQPGDRFYLLKAGRVEIFKPTPHTQVILNVLQPGEHFGEMSLLDDQPRSAAARAATDVALIEISKPIFLALVQRFPLLLYQAAHVSDERLRHRDRDLINQLTAHNRQLGKLYETSLDISRHRARDAALAAIVERAVALLNGSAGVIHLFDPQTHRLVAPLDRSRGTRSRGVIGRAFATGAPVIENRRARRELAAPICLDEKPLGALVVYRAPAAAAFTPEQAQLLLLFANQAAIAIENARLHALALEKARLDGELCAARAMQRSLIPTRAPRVPGFRLAGLWRPAREVSGDFYDFISLGNGCWGLVIADVCDKGMPAALFMATARSVVRASARAALTAVGAVEHANRVIAADASNGMFITLFLGILDPRARRLEYVNAGHVPPLWWRAPNARLERLSRTGIALGVDAEARYESRAIELAEGDLLLLYTDGVADALNVTDAHFGEARLARVLKSGASAEACAVVRAVDRAVSDFVGTCALVDDVTMVAVRCAASSG